MTRVPCATWEEGRAMDFRQNPEVSVSSSYLCLCKGTARFLALHTPSVMRACHSRNVSQADWHGSSFCACSFRLSLSRNLLFLFWCSIPHSWCECEGVLCTACVPMLYAASLISGLCTHRAISVVSTMHQLTTITCHPRHNRSEKGRARASSFK